MLLANVNAAFKNFVSKSLKMFAVNFYLISISQFKQPCFAMT